MATPIINEIGTDEQKKEFLAPALAGEKIAALGVSEPGGGVDVASLRTTARRVGDDYVINGAKMWITNGTRADFITLAVRTGEAGYGGISLVTFPTDVKGFRVSKKLDKVGNLSTDTAMLFFEDCRIPARYLLGEENQGFYHIMTNFQGERLVAAIGAVAGHAAAAGGRAPLRQRAQRLRQAAHPSSRCGATSSSSTSPRSRRRAGSPTAPATSSTGKEAAVKEITMAKLFAGDLVQKRGLRLPAVPRRHGLHRGDADRARVARRAPASPSAAAPARS